MWSIVWHEVEDVFYELCERGLKGIEVLLEYTLKAVMTRLKVAYSRGIFLPTKVSFKLSSLSFNNFFNDFENY